MSRLTRMGMFLGGFALVAIIAGCGGSGGDFRTAKVQGKVSYKGQPVTGGSLSFRPVASGEEKGLAGKPANGDIQADGAYSLSTYKAGDGAVVGKHEVSFSAPLPKTDGVQLKPGESLPKSPFDGLVPKDKTAEVKAGTNTIDIELVPAGGAR